MKLTSLETAFFETLDLLCRLKLGASDEAKATDKGVAFIEDCFELMCNIMHSDSECFFKLCAYYKAIQDSLPEGCDLSEEALTTKQLVSAVFNASVGNK
jgi:hypothetical protein